MILADSSVWVDHLREVEPRFQLLLDREQIVIHPFVIGEISLGSLRNRQDLLAMFARMNHLPLARISDVGKLIEARRLFSRGIGYVDVHLLASVLLVPSTQLWTRDRRFDGVAAEFGIAYAPPVN